MTFGYCQMSSPNWSAHKLKFLVAGSGLGFLRSFVSEGDRNRIDDALCPRTVTRHASWKASEWYQKELLRTQLATHHDNGSRRHSYLADYIEPIRLQLNAGVVKIVHPGCGCGRWGEFLRQYDGVYYTGFDVSPILIEYAQSLELGKRFRFVVADVLSLITVDQIDLILLDYEFLNAFDTAAVHSILLWAFDRLKDGGCVFGDYRPSNYRNGRRNPTRRFVIRSRDDRRVIWAEHGRIGKDFFGSQALVMDVRRLRAIHQCQNLIRLISEQDAEKMFSLSPWSEIRLDSTAHIPTTKPECQYNVRFFLRK